MTTVSKAPKKSLQDLIDEKGGPVQLLRNSRLRPERVAPYSHEHYLNGPVKPEEFSDWAAEQKAWHESAGMLHRGRKQKERSCYGRVRDTRRY